MGCAWLCNAGMKRDMGGAAGILGAFRTVAMSKSTGNRVVAVLCLAENSVVCDRGNVTSSCRLAMDPAVIAFPQCRMALSF
jgi:hypothetical protein